MEGEQFYKNKPANVAKVKPQRSVEVCNYWPRQRGNLCGICVWRRNGGEHFRNLY